MALLVNTACVLRPSPAELAEKMEEFAARGGFRPQRTYAVAASREIWKHDYTALDISFMAPSEPGSFPLIVYMPGLGEDAGAAELWRRAWAEAGYAVLAVQPVTLSRVLRSSDRISAGDLRALGRQYFAPTSLERRLAHVSWAVEELSRRARSSADRVYHSADPSRLAVAGFDIGGQAASAFAGEEVNGIPLAASKLAPRAAIILSPYLAVADGSSDARFANMAIPVLAVTGTEDDDPFGLTPASLRSVVWTAMPRGEKYLLSLTGGRHRELSGGDFGGPPDADGSAGAPAGFPGSAARIQASTFGGMGGASPPAGRGGGMMADGPSANGPPNFRHPAVVRSVTTAFFDAAVKDSAAARSWLTEDAAAWMGSSATLQRK